MRFDQVKELEVKDLNNWEENFEICIYAKRLLDKITHVNDIVETTPIIDIKAVKKAIYYARKYHGIQMRQSGEPYYSHPIEVAYMVSDYLFRTDMIVTAILHDTLEDTELTKEQISQEFGWKVANQVMDLTRIKEDRIKISAAETVEILYKEKKYDVLLIKLFDRLHNIQTLGAKSADKAKKIINETLETFVIYSMFFQHCVVENLLIQYCIEYYKCTSQEHDFKTFSFEHNFLY